MSSITRAADHFTVEQVKEKLHEAKDRVHFRRWLIVYNALIAPRKACDIADLLAVSTSLVHKVIFLYTREGAKALDVPGPGGRYHEYLSTQEEQAFLAPFLPVQKPVNWQPPRTFIRRLKNVSESQFMRTTVYRLLERHGWRKLMPRPPHPKADPQAQETFKKTIRRRSRNFFISESQTTSVQSF